MKHRHWISGINNTALLFGIVALSGCHTVPAVKPSLTPVRVSVASLVEVAKQNTYSANIQANAQVDLAFKSNGYVKSILQVRGADGRIRNVGEGDFVKRNTVLATVDESEYTEKLSQARAQLSRSQADYEKAAQAYSRSNTLYSAGAATKPDFDNATAQLASAKAAVQSAQASVAEAGIALGYCQLRAPFSSWILKRNVDVGSLVGPATNGFTIADTRQVKAVFGVPDTLLAAVHLGSLQTITSDAYDQAFHGRVTAISPAADPKSRVYSVEVTIPNPRNLLKVGMIASVVIGGSASTQRVLLIPLTAVVRNLEHGKGFAVFVVDGSGDTPAVHLQDITPGDAYGNDIAVLSGLDAGARVVTAGASMIRSGDRVQIAP